MVDGAIVDNKKLTKYKSLQTDMYKTGIKAKSSANTRWR